MLASLLSLSFLFPGFALAQEAPDSCKVDFMVTCTDCQGSFKAEIYQFNVDGTRMQVGYLPAMKSGESISSGSMTPGRRTLVVEDVEFVTVGCVAGEKVYFPVKVILHQEDTGPEEDDITVDPPPEAAAPVFHPPAPEPVPEPVSVPTLTASAPPTLPAPEPEMEEEEDEALAPVRMGAIPHKVGWATGSSLAVWTGNAGDYPSATEANRRGRFADPGVTQCPSGKLPAVLGTADSIRGGRPAQDALDDQRAKDLAPPGWNGVWAVWQATGILGDQAAAVWCINPGDLNPTSAEGRQMVAAAELPPPAPAGVTPQALQEALEDQATKLREELKPEEGSEPPATATSVPTLTPFVLRKGGFTAFQYSTAFEEGVAYPHAIVGVFVTFNLVKSERVGFEPYLGFGSDGKSDHCGDADWGGVQCSGWYLSANVGARLPIALVKKDTWRLLVFPDLALVSDDIDTGFHAWGELVSLQGGVEFWLTGKVPLAFSLETGATRLAFKDDSFQHQNGWAWPVRLDVKVAFK